MTSTPPPGAASINRQWRLAARPKGLPVATDWEYRTEPVPEPGDGEFLVRVLYISLDPAMRGWMNEGRSYVPPVGLGEVMRAGGVGRVVASPHPDFAAGDHVVGHLRRAGLRDQRRARRHAASTDESAPLAQYLSVLGMPGMTAYFGLLDDRPAGRGRDGGRLRRGRCGRSGGRTDRARSRAAASSASPAVRRSAASSSTSLASTRPSTTRARTSARRCASSARTRGRVLRQRRRRDPGRRAGAARAPRPDRASAARSRSTTTRARSAGRRTTWRCSSTGPAWRASLSSTTPTAMPRPRARWPAGSPTDG